MPAAQCFRVAVRGPPPRITLRAYSSSPRRLILPALLYDMVRTFSRRVACLITRFVRGARLYLYAPAGVPRRRTRPSFFSAARQPARIARQRIRLLVYTFRLTHNSGLIAARAYAGAYAYRARISGV